MTEGRGKWSTKLHFNRIDEVTKDACLTYLYRLKNESKNLKKLLFIWVYFKLLNELTFFYSNVMYCSTISTRSIIKCRPAYW